MQYGRYELIETLGQGGMATVHLALDPVLARHVAAKVIRTGPDPEGILELDSQKLSLVDINRIPILLAIQIVQLNRVLLCKNGMRLAREENRITGLYETDILYTQRKYG